MLIKLARVGALAALTHFSQTCFAGLGLCENMAVGFKAPTGTFEARASYSTLDIKADVVSRFSRIVTEYKLSPAHFRLMAAVVNGNLSHRRDGVEFAEASVASYAGEEINQLLKDYGLDLVAIDKLQNNPRINLAIRLGLVNSAYIGGSAGLDVAFMNVPNFQPTATVLQIAGGVILNLVTAFQSLRKDIGRNQEAKFLSRVVDALNDPMSVENDRPVFWERKTGRHYMEFLLSREAGAQIRLDIVRWRYRKRSSPLLSAD